MCFTLLSLSNELILIVAKYLDSQPAINALVQTCHRFYNLLLGYLFRYNSEHNSFSAIRRIATDGHIEALKRLLIEEESFDPVIRRLWRKPRSELKSPPPRFRYIDNPLRYAVRNGRDQTVALLLEAGADPNGSREGGANSALFEAVKFSQYSIVSMLLDETRSGAPIDKRCLLYPFLVAVTKKKGEDIIRCILDHMVLGIQLLPRSNPDLRIEDFLFKMIEMDYPKVVKILVPLVEIHVTLQSGYTPLALAASNGCDQIFDFLIEIGADPNFNG